MKTLVLTIFTSFSAVLLYAQNYDSYFTGNTIDLVTQPHGGICLMGGATEDDNAMIWFLEQANGGDVLVLRASGSDGYNAYFYSDLGVPINSVETIVFNDATASNETYIHQKIEQAEAIWFAGGDQWEYISYWRNTPIDSLINIALEERNIVIGGTSAGMAILGDVYFTAQNGTITSATALANPYSPTATIDSAAFIHVDYMTHVITDTHYDNPDRRGRHTVFMARMVQDYNMQARGIACEEYVAVCIDTLGIAHVYGGYPTYDEQAYFIQINCANSNPQPETCIASTPLTWQLDDNVLTVYKINGTSTGTNTFDLNNWEDGTGGEWQHWYVNGGSLQVTTAFAPDCNLQFGEFPYSVVGVSVFPNPADLNFTLSSNDQVAFSSISIIDLTGRIFMSQEPDLSTVNISTDQLQAGVYLLHFRLTDQRNGILRFVVR